MNVFIYLFIYSLTTLSVAQTKERRMNGWYMNDELERLWKEAVEAEFKVVSRHLGLPGRTEENREKSKKNGRIVLAAVTY
jgi:hypothetical protein